MGHLAHPRCVRPLSRLGESTLHVDNVRGLGVGTLVADVPGPMAPLPQVCHHCAQSLGLYRVGDFCCTGCQMASQLLSDRGLSRYYELRGSTRGVALGAATAGTASATSAGDSLQPPPLSPAMEATLAMATQNADADGDVRVSLDVEGLHCAGCVWTIQTLFQRNAGSRAIDVNPGQGRLDIVFHRDEFPVREFLEDLTTLGYRTGPQGHGEDSEKATRALLIRCGVATAIAINSMVLALAGYLGLPATDPLHGIFGGVNAVLGTLALIVGAPLFAVPAWRALRRRVLHLDLPIAVGMISAWAGSMALFVMVGPEAAYFDSLTVFVALMLAGRFLQHRMVARNRRRLRQDHGIAAMRTRRLSADGSIQHVPLSTVRPGDELLVAPGELVPTMSRTLEHGASVSLAWITGESDAIDIPHGATVAAGAHIVGSKAIRVEALEGFESSRLERLLRRASSDDESAMVASPFWGKVASIYVITVLALALIGFVAWWSAGAAAAIQVAVAVLVVTCPCAIGLATPLAEEMALADLRRVGLFARRSHLLDRLHETTTVVFDKTGTLTSDDLELVEPSAIATLSPFLQDRLFQLVGRSNHPRSRAIVQALLDTSPALHLDRLTDVEEVAGVGLSDGRFRVGRCVEDPERVSFWEDDTEVLRMGFEEPLKLDAPAQVAELKALGLDLWILSGDAQARVDVAAQSVGIDADHALGALNPEGKADRIRALGAPHVLMIGDGINDALAFETAGIAGTPAVDRPQLPARADFYILTQGVGPLAQAFRGARLFRRVIRRNIGFAVVYNTLGISAALAGLLSPLACAVFMPASSIIVLALTTAAMRSKTERPNTSPIPPLQAVGALA